MANLDPKARSVQVKDMENKGIGELVTTPGEVPESGVTEAISRVAPKGWRLKLARAAAQLIAGTERGAVAYGEIRDRLDTVEGRSLVSRTLAEAVAQQAVSDPEMLERAKARFLGTTLQKQQNLEAVIVGASKNLPLLPPPSRSDEFPAQLDAEKVGDINDGDALLDPDWAATFSNIAENASTHELRDRLSRVLAGEISSPGTYSRATIRQIAELEKQDLEAVKAILPYVLKDQIILTKEKPSQPDFEMLRPLLESGLATDATRLLSKNWDAASEDNLVYSITGNTWGLGFFMKVSQSLSLPVTPLTRTGNAVVDLLGRPDEREILKRIAAEVPDSVYAKIVIGRILDEKTLCDVEQLFPEVPSLVISPVSGSSPFEAPNLNPW